MTGFTRGMMAAAGAGAVLMGVWTQVGGSGEARATTQPPRVLHQGSYADFTLSDSEREARLSPDYQSCMERAAGTGDMRRCAADEHGRLTGLMDAALRNAISRASQPAVRERLRADQARWQQGRQAHCQRELRESGEEGGSMGLIVLDNCALGELVRRTMWLEQHR